MLICFEATSIFTIDFEQTAEDSLQQATRKEGVNRRRRWIDFEHHLKKSAQTPEKAEIE